MRKITKLWRMHNGKTIRICDMSDSHLENTIKMLRRKVEDIRLEIPFPNFQGEMAQYYAEIEYDYIMDCPDEELIPILEDLEDEQKRRQVGG